MTDLEKYIQKHKTQFEPPELNPKIWLSIENEMLKAKARRRSLYLKIVSMAASLLLGAVLFGGQLFNKPIRTERQLIEAYGFESHDFTQKVNRKKVALSKAMIPSQYIEDFHVLLQQLAFLDEQYLDYLNYIEENGYQPFIGDQLLNYYNSKIELLDKIQKEIEKVNYYETKFPSNDKQVVLPIS